MKEKTISAVLGKGSFNHNRRIFIASNVDQTRTPNNIEYTYQDIHDVYHQLFDRALEEYNAKQKRSDRKIANYYEHIRTGKQEKLFHEVIFQIGNKDDTNAMSKEGIIAKDILDEYMKSFQKRNPNLFVFSAHLHMDEETPHLHIDFVPYTTGSKRGLETRVSLKKALEQQGIKGSGRSETEWNLWIQSEKEVLSSLMEKHQIHWRHLGTHEEKLSVYDFKKKMRIQEVNELEQKISSLNQIEKQKKKDIDSLQTDFTILSNEEKELTEFTKEVGQNDFWTIKEPNKFESAKSYHKSIVIPFIKQIKGAVDKMIQNYMSLCKQNRILRSDSFYQRIENNDLRDTVDRLSDEVLELRKENKQLESIIRKIKKVIGPKLFDELLNKDKRKKVIENER